MILKKKIKNLYKKIIIYFFCFIYEKPKFFKKNKDIYIFKLHINGKKFNIFKLINGRVYTNKNDTTAYISKNNLIAEPSLQFKKFDNINSYNQNIKNNFTLQNGTPNFKKKFKGTVLSLLSGGASRDNFTHWFTDVLPRIALFEKKFNRLKIDKYYVPSVKHKFQLESLKLLGINKKKIISSEKYKHIQAEILYATSHPCHYLPTKVEEWSLNYLRKKFQNKLINNTKKKNNIFIDRDQLKMIKSKNIKRYTSYRILLNEDKIKKYLSSLGFLIFKPENYSFEDQIKIFSNASCVIGLYGAAMMMITFCKKNTNILEIMPLKAGEELRNISRKLKMNHHQIKIKPIYKSSTPQNGLLICNIDKIKKNLIKFGFKNI